MAKYGKYLSNLKLNIFYSRFSSQPLQINRKKVGIPYSKRRKKVGIKDFFLFRIRVKTRNEELFVNYPNNKYPF